MVNDRQFTTQPQVYFATSDLDKYMASCAPRAAKLVKIGALNGEQIIGGLNNSKGRRAGSPPSRITRANSLAGWTLRPYSILLVQTAV